MIYAKTFIPRVVHIILYFHMRDFSSDEFHITTWHTFLTDDPYYERDSQRLFARAFFHSHPDEEPIVLDRRPIYEL